MLPTSFVKKKRPVRQIFKSIAAAKIIKFVKLLVYESESIKKRTRKIVKKNYRNDGKEFVP